MPKNLARALPSFPIVECFGFDAHAQTQAARSARDERTCPFAKNACEKFRQYGFGYCSVSYAAKDDAGKSYTYAVCDHRVDGEPIKLAIADAIGTRKYELVPEVVLTDPRTSFDYVVLSKDGEADHLVAIETQAIDIRGGGVGPAWRAWSDEKIEDWRDYFSIEAAEKGRKDTVAFGVNMANIYKRLGLQVATKGTLLKAIGVKLYVVMQDRPFQYLHNRVRFEPTDQGSDWDVTFMTFDYDGTTSPSGQLGFSHVRTIRTTLEAYTTALSNDHRATDDQRQQFLDRVKIKAKQSRVGAA